MLPRVAPLVLLLATVGCDGIFTVELGEEYLFPYRIEMSFDRALVTAGSASVQFEFLTKEESRLINRELGADLDAIEDIRAELSDLKVLDVVQRSELDPATLGPTVSIAGVPVDATNATLGKPRTKDLVLTVRREEAVRMEVNVTLATPPSPSGPLRVSFWIQPILIVDALKAL